MCDNGGNNGDGCNGDGCEQRLVEAPEKADSGGR